MKECRDCNITKSLIEFTKAKGKPTNWCKSCRAIYKKAYDSKPENKAIKKAYYLDYKKNREAIDVDYKLKNALRRRVYNALKNGWKSGSAVDDLGCTIEELKKHLEDQFESGMSWDNWSKTGWHIDHIKPLSSFDLTNPEEFKKACHYTNLQPMWAEDNLRKGSTLA